MMDEPSTANQNHRCPLCDGVMVLHSKRDFFGGGTRFYWRCKECLASLMSRPLEGAGTSGARTADLSASEAYDEAVREAARWIRENVGRSEQLEFIDQMKGWSP